jgi:hypothetical protein
MDRRPGVPDRRAQVLAAISTCIIAGAFAILVGVILASCG